MPPSLFAASAHAVRNRGIGAPAIAAILLSMSTWSARGSHGNQILLAVTAVLGLVLQSAVDDPGRFISEATPYTLARRTLNRVAAASAVVLPVWLVTAVALRWQTHSPPVLAVGLQTLTLWAFAVVVAMVVWRVSASTTPSYVASPALLATVLAGYVLPPRWQLFGAQEWGPPWVAAQLRWCALLTIAVAALSLLLSDPMTRATTQRHGLSR